jgi:SAM-dependent methyltransferase
MPNLRAFYDNLAAHYHLNYRDWHEAVPRQGKVLAKLIRDRGDGHDASTVLDCSCGIGTQAIGLAIEGFEVTGTDLSPASVERAKREAEAFGVTAAFSVADMRQVANLVPGTFDVVISCDNSLPHLMTDADLRLALANMYEKLRPGGLLVIGIRDYDALAREQPRFTPPQLVEGADQRSVLFQLWDWADDGASYQLTMFVHRQVGETWETDVHVADYRALLRDDLHRFVHDAGFSGIHWHAEQQTGHHQPLMTAIRPRAEGRT